MSARPVMRDWPSVELRRLVKTSGGLTPSKAIPAFWGGDVPWVSPKDMKTFRITGSIDTITTMAVRASGIELLKPGAVLMVTRGMILDHTVPIALNEVPVTVNQDMKALVCLKHLRSEYLAWALLGHQDELLARVEVAGHGTCALRTDQWGALALPLPPLDEQTQIAKFLDYETAKIDQLIGKQQQLIALLKEKRQAVISHAVTKGLNPDAPMKDSGVEWLGRVPAHWEVTRLKFLVSHVVDCHHSTPKYDPEAPWPALRTADVSPGWLDVKGARRVHTDEYMERVSRLKPRPGDVIYSREGERWGMAALVPKGAEVCLAQRVMLFRAGARMGPELLMWALNSEAVYNQLAVDVVGATSPHVNIGDIREVWVAVPPSSEQESIVDHLNQVLGKLERLDRQAADLVDVLQERRTALISAAVTGKIDVRNWRPPDGHPAPEAA